MFPHHDRPRFANDSPSTTWREPRRRRRRNVWARHRPWLEVLEDRTLLAGSVSWINPNGGDWEIGSNWSDGIVPTSFEDANITIPVSNPITLSEADQVDSLNTDDPIVLGPGSSLSIVRTAGLSASMTLQGGTIEGGTISATDGATLVSNGGTLSGVTVVNTLDITGSSTTVTGGLTLNGGTIELGSSGDEGFDLVFQGAQSLGGTGTVVLGANGGDFNTESSNGDSGTLTIGSGVTIEGSVGTIGSGNTPLDLQGVIDAGGLIQITGTSWTNSGTLEASDGGLLYLEGTWSDSGTITANSAGVNLQGSGSVVAGSTFTGSDGAIVVQGTLDNTGNTLAISGTGLTCNLQGGTIEGGTISTADGAALVETGFGGTLAGVTVANTLDITGNGGAVAITGGLTLDGGTIELGSSGDEGIDLVFQGAQSLGGTGTVVLGVNGGDFNTESSNGDSGTLTIGSGVTIEGSVGTIGSGSTPLDLQGVIDAGGFIQITGTSWTNSGTLEASEGGLLYLEGTWSDSGTITASSAAVSLQGSGSVVAGSTFTGSDGTITVQGTLDNSGNALAISGTGLTCNLLGGTIEGGTISTAGGASLVATNFGGTLMGVTLAGTLDISVFNGFGADVTVSGGLTLDGGTIELGAGLIFQGAEPGRHRDGGPGNKRRRLHGEFRRRLGNTHHRPRRDHRGISRHHRFRQYSPGPAGDHRRRRLRPDRGNVLDQHRDTRGKRRRLAHPGRNLD